MAKRNRTPKNTIEVSTSLLAQFLQEKGCLRSCQSHFRIGWRTVSEHFLGGIT
uniref:Uncharacterized protein n=1 Tax=Rhizophora mucronata TaxID=61149 RepID=A0A2P2NTH9_RHIMU